MHNNEIETYFKFLFITSLLLLGFGVTGSLGRLTDVPKNNFVFKGATVVFTCCSDVQEPFFWKVKYISSSSIEYIYDAGFVNGFRDNGRFNVTDGSRSGCYSLIIADVRANDAGTYFCVDYQGLGQQKGWELVIVESLDCQEKNRKAEYMGENKFGLPQDVFSTMCISTYFGNFPPKPICGWSSGIQIFDNHQHVTETNLTTTLTIQMPARKEFNGDQLFCYLKIDGEASENQAATGWTSSQLIINYASFHQRGVSKCSVDDLLLDCQPPCNYKTIRSSNGSSYCEITYPRKTHQQFLVSLQDNNLLQPALISSTTNLPVENHSTVTITVISVLICCVFAGVIAAQIIISKRRKRQRRRKAMHDDITLDLRSNTEMPADEPCHMVATSLLPQPTTLSTPASIATMGAGTCISFASTDSGAIGTDDDFASRKWQNTSLGPSASESQLGTSFEGNEFRNLWRIRSYSTKKTTDKKLQL